jgi:hypothetical protein
MSEIKDEQIKKPLYKRTWFLVVAGLVLVAIISSASGGDNQAPSEQTDSNSQMTASPSESPTGEASDNLETTEPEPAVSEFAWPTMTEILLEGNGDDVVLLDQAIPTVAAMDVFANSAGRYFGLKPVFSSGDSGISLVNTTDSFDGTVLLLGSGNEAIVGFEVTANGAWAFSIKSISKMPKLLPGEAFSGNGDALVQLDETQALTTIAVVGNSQGRYFGIKPHGNSSISVINTTDAYDGRVRLDAGTVLLEVTATGDWRITLE